MPSNLWGQLNALNEKLSLNQKISIAALATVMLLGTFTFVYLIQQPDYQLVFSNLDAANANVVIESLKQSDVPYQLSDGGRSISVPSDRVDEVRIEIASQGLPTAGRIGFELFDQNKWGITDFAEKVNYRRALEGELEKTLRGLNEISFARVHLVMEKDSLFEEDAEPAKASVVIKLSEPAGLAPKKVAGIRNLVAFSVEGLSPDKVTLVDVYGNLLSGAESPDQQLSGAELDYRHKVERDLSQKVVSILEPLVGKNKVRVTTSVELDRVEMEQSEELFDPASAVVVSQQKTAEVAGQQALVQGVPFQANDASSLSASGQPPSGRSSQSETLNYEVSKTLRQTRSSKGGIRRLSVAVVVDHKSEQQTSEEGQVTESNEPRQPEEMEQLRALVASTIGFDASRGDNLTVENISFMRVNEEPVELPEPGFLQQYQPLINQSIRYFSILLLFLLFYLMIFRPVKKRVFAYVDVKEPNLARLASSNPELAKLLREGGATLSDAQQLALQSGSMDEGTAMRRQLTELAQKDPALVSQMIRSWLSEGA